MSSSVRHVTLACTEPHALDASRAAAVGGRLLADQGDELCVERSAAERDAATREPAP